MEISVFQREYRVSAVGDGYKCFAILLLEAPNMEKDAMQLVEKVCLLATRPFNVVHLVLIPMSPFCLYGPTLCAFITLDV